jgi:antitoxin MazE
MNLKVVRIGNSRGIRIPKSVLDQCQIEESVKLMVRAQKIIIEPVKQRPREGWESAARQMHEAGEDALLIPDVFQDEAEEAWS